MGRKAGVGRQLERPGSDLWRMGRCSAARGRVARAARFRQGRHLRHLQRQLPGLRDRLSRRVTPRRDRHDRQSALIDDETLARARELATRRGTSLNQMIRDYLQEIASDLSPEEIVSELGDLWATSGGNSAFSFRYGIHYEHVYGNKLETFLAALRKGLSDSDTWGNRCAASLLEPGAVPQSPGTTARNAATARPASSLNMYSLLARCAEPIASSTGERWEREVAKRAKRRLVLARAVSRLGIRRASLTPWRSPPPSLPVRSPLPLLPMAAGV